MPRLLALLLTAFALNQAIVAPSLAQEAAAISPTTPAYRALFVYHPATRTVLTAENANVKMGPASLTKLMTLYLTFDALKSGKIQLTTPVNISEKAWRTGGSKMFVEVGKQVPVEDLIKGIAIVSGNDACVAIAEHLGGTEEGFVQAMNAKAKELGMNNTTFADSNGLPSPSQLTTAQDVGLLLTALFRDFPEYKHYLAMEEFTFNGIKQQNRNGLLHADMGIDAGKTGHTEESGYHLASTAVQNGERLVVVVMGTDGFNAREGQSMQAYRTAFANYATKTFFKVGDAVVPNVPVWHGSSKMANLTVAEPLAAFLATTNTPEVKATITYQQPILAPAAADKPLGEITLTLPSGQTFTTALVPQTPIAQAGFAGRFLQSMASLFGL
ncbi:MAG: D-alanyl-D-alanine carboxypeptidase [Proteobacteria bacterium]|nr:D-alanyl-D-alanine carboxypeptidase [Pseudomonadota bacterium]NBX85827.1 D-alanyl-D-alanine carboxypeptidase [Pseudomonadota bacterium]